MSYNSTNIHIAVDANSRQKPILEHLRSSTGPLMDAVIGEVPDSPQEIAKLAEIGTQVMIAGVGASDKRLKRLLDNWRDAPKRPVMILLGSNFEDTNSQVAQWWEHNDDIKVIKQAIEVCDGHNAHDIRNMLPKCMDIAADLSLPLSRQLPSTIVEDVEIREREVPALL